MDWEWRMFVCAWLPLRVPAITLCLRSAVKMPCFTAVIWSHGSCLVFFVRFLVCHFYDYLSLTCGAIGTLLADSWWLACSWWRLVHYRIVLFAYAAVVSGRWLASLLWHRCQLWQYDAACNSLSWVYWLFCIDVNSQCCVRQLLW